MVRIQTKYIGDIDKVIKRKPRNDKGKSRKFYAGEKVKYHNYPEYFKNNYGKNIEFTEFYKEKARKFQRIYYNKNKEDIQKERWEITKSDPEKYLKYKVRSTIRNMFRIYIKTGRIMSSSKYRIDYKKIIEHLKPFPKNVKEYHPDHIKPLCLFTFLNKDGSINYNEIKKAYAPENFQWLTVQENLRKNRRY